MSWTSRLNTILTGASDDGDLSVETSGGDRHVGGCVVQSGVLGKRLG